MSWDYTASEAKTVPSTTSVNVDRAVIEDICITFSPEKRLVVKFGVGVINGAGIDRYDEIVYQPDEATFDAIMAAATNDPEDFEAALKRLILTQANIDGVLPAGSIV
jgi:hypothetical protein